MKTSELSLERYNELTKVLRKNSYRYNWCTAYEGCLCMGCVQQSLWSEFDKLGYVRPTYEEWLEWAFWESQLELYEAQQLLIRLTNQTQQKKIPTLAEYKARMTLIDEVKAWMRSVFE